MDRLSTLSHRWLSVGVAPTLREIRSSPARTSIIACAKFDHSLREHRQATRAVAALTEQFNKARRRRILASALRSTPTDGLRWPSVGPVKTAASTFV
jgi:hypothetical protein